MCTCLGLQRSGGNHTGRERSPSHPGLFQAELLVQHTEEVRDGEIASGGCFEGHGVTSEKGLIVDVTGRESDETPSSCGRKRSASIMLWYNWSGSS